MQWVHGFCQYNKLAGRFSTISYKFLRGLILCRWAYKPQDELVDAQGYDG